MDSFRGFLRQGKVTSETGVGVGVGVSVGVGVGVLGPRGIQELNREGGLHPILSPTKLTVRQNFFLSARLPA